MRRLKLDRDCDIGLLRQGGTCHQSGGAGPKEKIAKVEHGSLPIVNCARA
jgi:hypothetical protein